MQALFKAPLAALRRGIALSGLAALAWAAASPAQAADVGVSISISQPGVYGRVDIGRFPQPQVVLQQPVFVQRTVRAPAPVYMYVPVGHRKNWRQHCRSYGACGVPVYFVQDRWYDQKVRPYARGYDERYDRRYDRRQDRWEDRRDGRWDSRWDGHRDGPHGGKHDSRGRGGRDD